MKDITLYEFNSPDEFEKGSALWEFGVFLSQRFEEEIGYNLYQLNNYYVEVQYNGGINATTKFTSFSTNTKLEPYLDKIDISKVIG
jgi:hypothetical protein